MITSDIFLFFIFFLKNKKIKIRQKDQIFIVPRVDLRYNEMLMSLIKK